jgi:hypothetical protein
MRLNRPLFRDGMVLARFLLDDRTIPVSRLFGRDRTISISHLLGGT